MNKFILGQNDKNVMQLQQFLNCNGFQVSMDGIFGRETKSALDSFLKKNESDSECIDLMALITRYTKVDSWCESIQNMEGYFPPGTNSQYPKGTPSWKNNNPGNLEFAHQKNAIANGRFAQFATYQDGYNALKNMLIRACTDQISAYRSTMNLLEFYEVYSPWSDGNDPVEYSQKVAKDLGVNWETTKIKDLLL